MKFLSFFAFTSLVITVSAYGDVGTFERLWYWYAYQLDPDGKTIAPNCGKAMGAGTRCNFVQFMNYIEQGSTDTLDPSKLNGIDPMDIPSASQALKDGGYIGTYDCTHVYQNLPAGEDSTPARNNVAGLFLKLSSFCYGTVATASTALQDNLVSITQAVYRGRQGNAVVAYKNSIPAIVLDDVAMYDGAPDVPNLKTQEINENASASTKQAKAALIAQIKDLQKSDGIGHYNNARNAKLAAGQVSKGCQYARE